MSERIKWNNFVPNIGSDVIIRNDLNLSDYAKDSHCEARVMLKSSKLDQGGRLVTAELSCQRCEWGIREFTAVTPEDSQKPLREIKEVRGKTASYLTDNCPKLNELYESSEIRPDMLPPILRGS
jgi:hypothetical protein